MWTVLFSICIGDLMINIYSWHLMLLAYVLIGYGVLRIILKKTLQRISQLPPTRKVTLIAWQFFFCVILSGVAIMPLKEFGFEKGLELNVLWLFVLAIGGLNAFGNYCHWSAINISLSRASVLTQFDDIIAVALGYFLLGESKIFNLSLWIGILSCLAAAGIMTLAGKPDRRDMNWRLLKYVIGFSIIWGVADASFRAFNLKKLPLSEFLLFWYAGSFLGSCLIFCFFKFFKRHDLSFKLFAKDKREVPLLALGIWIPMFLLYWVAKYVPVAVFQPVLLGSEVVFSTILGLYYFHEKESLSSAEKIAIGIGLLGILGIILTFKG